MMKTTHLDKELEHNAAVIAAGFIAGCGPKWNWAESDPEWISDAAFDIALALRKKAHELREASDG